MKRLSWLGLAMALLTGCGGSSSNGGNDAPSRNVVGVTTDGRLVTFDTRRPNAILTDAPITGIIAGQTIIGIDQRPATQDFVLVSNTGVVYTLNVSTGAATPVGADQVVVDATASASDIDFNPQVDRLRLGNTSDENLRIVPNTGAQVDGDADSSNGVQPDTPFAYTDATDAQIVGLAYTNSVAGATATTLYAIDRAQDRLVTLASPNSGVLTTVGSLGTDVVDYAPFDITPDNSAAVAAIGATERSRLVRIDLTTGSATTIGQTPIGTKLIGFAFDNTAG